MTTMMTQDNDATQQTIHDYIGSSAISKWANKELKQRYHIKVDAELRNDCAVWKTFLEQPDSLCRPFMDFSEKLIADQMDFYTDALGSNKPGYGFGCVFGKRWAQQAWGSNFIADLKPSIEFLELFAVAVAIHLWANLLQNRRVVIFCDNQSVIAW